MKRFLFIAAALFCAACAQPKYEKNNTNDKNQKSNAETHSLSFLNQNLKANIFWSLSPVEKQTTELSVKFYQLKNNQPVTAPLENTLKVFLWMPEMNHGSVPVQIEKISESEFRIKNIYFIMPGFWQMHFQVLNNEILIDEAIYDIYL